MAGTVAVSPRMQALWDDYARRGEAAVEAFWLEVEATGTPLIEPIAGDGDHSSVTFVWRLEEPGQRVGLVHGPLRGGELDPLDLLGTSELAFRTYRVANDLRNAYWFIPDPPRSLAARSAEEWGALRARFAEERFLTADPLNPKRSPQLRDPLDPTSEGPGDSILEMPDAPSSVADGESSAPAGTLVAHRFESELLSEPHSAWVHTPASYDEGGGPCDLLVVFDGQRALDALGMPAILDQLVASGRLRPTVTVFVESLAQSRHIELACHEPFVEFLVAELVPWLQANYRVTADPARTTLAGTSLGGLAASFAALRHPERFGNVLSQSGSYWWEPVDREQRYIGPEERQGEWLTSTFRSAAAVPVRFYLEAGTLEETVGGVSLRSSVRRFHNVLSERGYDVTHHEFNGGHAWACWRASFAKGLTSLVGTEGARN